MPKRIKLVALALMLGIGVGCAGRSQRPESQPEQPQVNQRVAGSAIGDSASQASEATTPAQTGTHALSTSAGNQHCTCNGATTSYTQIDCAGPNGTKFKATKTCWTKKVLETGASCGTVCEADINVCAGNHGTCG